VTVGQYIVGGELEAEHHKKCSARLKSLVQELNIEERVVSTEFRSDVPQVMGASDIITHCSTYSDSFPGNVMQGMVVGKPVIASNLGGPKEQIEHGDSGMLVPPNNPEKLAESKYRYTFEE
jgi:glycosyltransferase involved in cell wall biosynthesis